MNPRLPIDEQQLETFCRKWRIVSLELFGSVLRDDFSPESDVDVLATFAPGSSWSLLEHQEMQGELSDLVGRPVDLVTRRAVERGSNWLRREEILKSAETWYAAG